MKVRNAGARYARRDAIANRAQLRRTRPELRRDDHRDARRGSREKLFARRDPLIQGRLAPQHVDRELAAGARGLGPRAKLVGFDDLDDVTVENAPHLGESLVHASILGFACHLEGVVKVWIPLLLVTSVAHADPAERCAKGKELAAGGKELPRAALYLEACTDDDGVRLKNSLAHKLEESQLSLLTISSLPDGAIAEIDAYPGEQLTTPASVWVKPGTYKITINGMTVEKTVEPRSRTTVIVNAPPPKKDPKTGVVSFED